MITPDLPRSFAAGAPCLRRDEPCPGLVWSRRPVFIERLHIRNLKLLRDFTLDFTTTDGKPRLWTVIIGPNGTAKTSILQAIALAAAGSLQANGLAKPVVGHLVDRRGGGRKSMEIVVDFRFSERGSRGVLHPLLGRDLKSSERLRSTVTLKSKQSTLLGASEYYDGEIPLALAKTSRLSPLDDARANNRPLWFVAGYGVGRFLPEPQSRPPLVQPSIERLEPLFRNTTGLTSLGFLDHLPREKRRAFAKVLRDTLIGVDELVPALTGIELAGRGGVSESGSLIDRERFQLKIGRQSYKLPAVALSHGYQSVLAWIADLIGHVMWEASDAIEAADIEGLVLIDEIDLYLHPQWQAGLIAALRRTFPKVQFIATTHSPVVLSSLRPDEIAVLGQNSETGDVERWIPDPRTGEFLPTKEVGTPVAAPDPRAMSGTDVYRTWFGLDRLTLNPHGQMLREYLLLATDPHRSNDEDKAMRSLAAKLVRVGIEARKPVAREGQ